MSLVIPVRSIEGVLVVSSTEQGLSLMYGSSADGTAYLTKCGGYQVPRCFRAPQRRDRVRSNP